jgi:hypothetical protein
VRIRVFFVVGALILAGSAQLAAQDADAVALIERARQSRGSEAAGLSAYEALIRERLYIGLSIASFRRERGLFRSERVARVRWQESGPETVEWLGVRQRIPIAGADAAEEFDPEDDLGSYPLDPTGDRLRFGAEDFLHPLADSASSRYTYRMADTSRILIPALDREIVMVEVTFEPEDPAFELLAGSLWFDLESAALIRGVFRPSRPFDMELDNPEDADELPGFLKPLVVEFDVIIVEYGLQDLQWWIAHRVRLEGVAKAGSLLRVPVTLETVASEFVMNGGVLDPMRDPPPGWVRVEVDDGERIVYAPPDSVLENSPYLTDDRFGHESDAFSDDELNFLRGQLDAVRAHQTASARPSLRPGAWRFNRVEALSVALTGTVPIGEIWSVTGQARFGLGDRVPNAELRLTRGLAGGELSIGGYAALRSASDWGNPFSVESSATVILLGYDDGQYYRALGGEVRMESGAGSPRFDVRLFAEHNLAVSKHTDIGLPDLFGSSELPENLAADEVDIFGAGGSLRLQSGSDPDGWILLFGLKGEAATGTGEYTRLSASTGVSRPIAGRLAAAAEFSAGAVWGDVPVQKTWLLGGPSSIRAFPGGSVAGEAFGLGRFELAYGLPALRLAAFADVAWAGDRSRFLDAAPAISAGVGLSVLDGILRLDLAHVIQGRSPERLRVHLYFDGLL